MRLVANYWREIGAEVAIHTVDATQSTALWKDNTSDGMLGSVSAITYEPRNGIGRFTTGHVWNGTAGSDAEIDEFWERASTAATLEESNRWAKAVNLRLLELQWTITVH